MPEDPGDQLPDTSTPSADATPHSGGATALPARPVPPAGDDVTIWMLTMLAATDIAALIVSVVPALLSTVLVLGILWQGRPKRRYRINVREATREARVASILVWLVLLKMTFDRTHWWNWHNIINGSVDSGVEAFRDAAGWLLVAGLIVGWADGYTNARLEAKDMEYQRELEKYQRELEDFKHRGITS